MGNSTSLKAEPSSLSAVSVVWKIQKFSLYSTKKEKKLKSPSFSCSDAEWALQMYPLDDKEEDDATEYVCLYIVKIHSPIQVHNVHYTMGFKDRFDNLQCAITANYDFEGDGSGFGEAHVITFRELLEKKKELLSNDTLTVICTLKIHYGAELLQQAFDSVVPVTSATAMCKDISTLLSSGKNCDMAFHVGGKEFKAHKLILAARSSVFAAMFEHDMKESSSNVVTISDMQPLIFGDMLDYIYSANTSHISAENARDLYIAADKYDLKELKWKCGEVIMSGLSVDTFCDTAILGDMHNDGKMMDCLKRFAQKHFSEVIRTEHWDDLLKANPVLATKIIREVTVESHNKSQKSEEE